VQLRTVKSVRNAILVPASAVSTTLAHSSESNKVTPRGLTRDRPAAGAYDSIAMATLGGLALRRGHASAGILRNAPVDFFPVTNLHNKNRQNLVLNLADDTVALARTGWNAVERLLGSSWNPGPEFRPSSPIYRENHREDEREEGWGQAHPAPAPGTMR